MKRTQAGDNCKRTLNREFEQDFSVGLGATFRADRKFKNIFLVKRIFPGKADSAIFLGFECWWISRAHSPSFPSLHLRHSSFSNLSVALPTSQLIHQPFHCFTYVTVHSPALLILQPFRHFTYVTAHSPALPSLHLRHSSFSNPSFASPTSHALHLRHLARQTCDRF